MLRVILVPQVLKVFKVQLDPQDLLDLKVYKVLKVDKVQQDLLDQQDPLDLKVLKVDKVPLALKVLLELLLFGLGVILIALVVVVLTKLSMQVLM